ncbi:exopolyphosphatase prune [Lycorma delicatula]|uniref:exopolyphosphatase prune n=1 Tax=Lycorma delicatula TaxID=130591 RepID=UPI003F518797
MVDVSLGLGTFLSTSKHIFESGNEINDVTVVIGNESCDLDSAVSSIIYAYFLCIRFSEEEKDRNVNNGSIIIPVLNIERKYYPLKTEVKYFLNTNNICEDSIVFRNEIDLVKLHEEKKLKLVLVDHHILPEDLQGLENSVIKVIDHRPIDKKSNWSNEVVIIEPVGSCTTLVADEIIKENKNIMTNENVALLIYGTIILDTYCFSETVKRYTDLDREIVNQCKILGKIDISEDDLFNQLKESKNDVSQLSAPQLLIKDMKTVYNIPISTLTTLAQDFLQKVEAHESIKSHCKEFNASVCIILGVDWHEDVHYRDVYVYYEDDSTDNEAPCEAQQKADFIVQHLIDYSLLDLELIKTIYSGYLFKQKDTTWTRKHVIPVVENACKYFIPQ